MRAIVQDQYGSPDVLEFRDIDTPAVKDDEVLVRVKASSVNPRDWHVMTGLPYLARLLGRSLGFGLRKPRRPTLGWDVAGIVEAVGQGVDRLHPGDEVFGWADGAFAEFVSAGADDLVLKPAGLTFEQAAACSLAGLTALQAVRDHGRLQFGQNVLINGVGRSGHLRGADRLVAWCRSHRSVQHQERRHGQLHRRRPSDRLHP